MGLVELESSGSCELVQVLEMPAAAVRLKTSKDAKQKSHFRRSPKVT